jgi:O-antigen ligase
MTLVVTQLTAPIITFGLRGQDVNSLLTLSGRTNAFAFLLEQWKQSPLLGIGYGAGSRFLLMRFVAESGLGIGAAHDALSKVLVELGLVGTVLVTVIVAVIWREMFQLMRIVRRHFELRPVAARLFAMLAYFTLTSIVSAGISEVQYAFLVIAICVAVVRHRAGAIMASGNTAILSPCHAA